MTTVKNLTNSPYDLQAKGGFVRLPAFGEVSGEFTGDYLQLLEASLAVKVLNAPTARDPLDHDGDGKKGGSKPAPDRDLDDLRAQYEELFGEAPDKRWGAPRLQSAIDEELGE